MISDASTKYCVFNLPTAKVTILGKDSKPQLATILFDKGSDRSKVSFELVEKMSLKVIHSLFLF